MARPLGVADREIVVGIDLGTSACKVVAFDCAGNRVAQGRSAYRSNVDSQGKVEQDPRIWWNAIGDAFRRAEIKRFETRVVGYAVSSLRAAILPVDSKQKPLAEAILAPDSRARAEAEFLARRFGEKNLYKKTGLRCGTYSSLARILWLEKHKPDIFAKTRRIFCAQDYVIQRLCGRIVTDRSQASRTLCLNVRTKAWDSAILRSVRLRSELFPELVDPGAIAGEVTNAAGRDLDIPIAPVIAAGGDQMCASVGLGACKEGRVTINHGTGSFIESPAARPRFDGARKSLLSVHVLPDTWIQEFPMLVTGRLVQDLVAGLTGNGDDVSAILTAALEADALPSERGFLLFLPYQAGSTAPHWAPSLKGGLWGLQGHHGIVDIVRTLLCGVVFDLRRCIELLPAKPKELVVGGRLSNFDAFNQMQADICGIPVVRTFEPEATALGAAAIAFASLGYIESPQQAAKRMVRIAPGARYFPRKKIQACFEEMFQAQGRLLALALSDSKG